MWMVLVWFLLLALTWVKTCGVLVCVLSGIVVTISLLRGVV